MGSNVKVMGKLMGSNGEAVGKQWGSSGVAKCSEKELEKRETL